MRHPRPRLFLGSAFCLLWGGVSLTPLLAAPPRGNIDTDKPETVGYLDVTASPYSADATGQRDSTEAIQKAVDAGLVVPCSSRPGPIR